MLLFLFEIGARLDDGGLGDAEVVSGLVGLFLRDRLDF